MIEVGYFLSPRQSLAWMPSLMTLRIHIEGCQQDPILWRNPMSGCSMLIDFRISTISVLVTGRGDGSCWVIWTSSEMCLKYNMRDCGWVTYANSFFSARFGPIIWFMSEACRQSTKHLWGGKFTSFMMIPAGDIGWPWSTSFVFLNAEARLFISSSSNVYTSCNIFWVECSGYSSLSWGNFNSYSRLLFEIY